MHILQSDTLISWPITTLVVAMGLNHFLRLFNYYFDKVKLLFLKLVLLSLDGTLVPKHVGDTSVISKCINL